MINFLNLLVAGGLAAAAIPILVHIFHRRRITQVDWAAMRFLQEMLARRRRRLLLDQLLLLLVRCAMLAILATALMRPVWVPPADPAAPEDVIRQGRTASVILIDDSPSTAAGRDETAMERMHALAEAYIGTLEATAEISVLRLSEIGQPQADPIYDHGSAIDLVRAAAPTAVTSDMPALLEAGIGRFGRHLNPGRELVLITDGYHDGWHEDDRGRWSQIRRQLGIDNDDATLGTRERPRLIVLAPEPARAAASSGNLAITHVAIDRSLVPVDADVGFRVGLRHQGEHLPVGMVARLHVNGRAVDERELDLQPDDQREIVFQHRFEAPGSHVVRVEVEGARDDLAIDNRRALAVDVVESLPVLLLEGAEGDGIDGSLGFASFALGAGQDGGLFDVRRIGIGDFTARDLDDVRVVVIGDVAALDGDAVAAIERFVVGGGGVLVSLGPRTDPELVNRFWARGGDGFLPAPLGERVDAETDTGAVPGIVVAGHPALVAFDGSAAAAWQEAAVRAWHQVDLEAVRDDDVAVIMRLDTGDPFVIERQRGQGRVVLLTASLSLDWSDLPIRPAFVPLVRGLIGHLGATVHPPRNLSPGDRLIHVIEHAGATPVGVGPDGSEVPLVAGVWEDRSVVRSDPLRQAGVIAVREDAEEPVTTHYTVNLAAAESQLTPIDDTDRDRAIGGLDALHLATPEAIDERLAPAHMTNTELWRWLLAATIALLFLETWLTRRMARRESQAVNMQADALVGGRGA